MFCIQCQKYTKQTFHVCNCVFLCQNCFLDSYVIYNYEYLIYPETCTLCTRPLSDKRRELLKTYIKKVKLFNYEAKSTEECDFLLIPNTEFEIKADIVIKALGFDPED